MNARSTCRRLLVGLAIVALAGCSSNKGSPENPDADENVIPAASLQNGPTLADLTGGDLGLGGGFLIGAAPDKVAGRAHDQALAASHHAEESPAQLLDVRKSQSADLNGDGFLTLDEVLAMVRTGLSDQEIAQRLAATHFVFQITGEQERYLTDRGVSQNVVDILHRAARRQ